MSGTGLVYGPNEWHIAGPMAPPMLDAVYVAPILASMGPVLHAAPAWDQME